ncbi:MAG: GFA family protein [Opitutaceae bacterium]
MQKTFSGGCMCGAVRYECTVQPEELQMFKCHCRDCQRISGGPYAPVVYLPPNAVKLTKGTLAHYATPSLVAGHNLRGFCSQCGSRLTGGEGSTGIGVTVASLDDPSWFRPQFEIWLSDAQPWEASDPAVPKFEKYPPPK